jgi:hypothetical protein
MQEWFQPRLRVEVPRRVEQHEVGREARAAYDLGAEARLLVIEESETAEQGHGDEHNQQGGEEAQRAAGIELREAKALLGNAAAHDARDEKARDHEEDVDSDEAARDELRCGVEGDDCEDGPGPQTVDVGAVVGIARTQLAAAERDCRHGEWAQRTPVS